MSALQAALRGVGYRPAPQRKPTLQNIIDHIFPIKPRKIVVQRAGGVFKARFEGKRNFCFGPTPNEAIQRLKTQGFGRYA